jgi:hypothetical protein
VRARAICRIAAHDDRGRLCLRPGVEALPGLISSYAGADEATSSLMNVSLWKTLADAKQLDTFQPMLDLGKAFVQKGAVFERPVMNYSTPWQLRGAASEYRRAESVGAKGHLRSAIPQSPIKTRTAAVSR